MSRTSRLAVGALAVAGIGLALIGVTDLLVGAAAHPAVTIAISGLDEAEVQAADPAGYRLYDFVTRTQGLLLAVVGLLGAAIALAPYRAGQRWSWAVSWWMPIWGVLVAISYVAYGLAPGVPPAAPMVLGPILAAVSATVLVADRRRFAGGGEPRVSRELQSAEG